MIIKSKHASNYTVIPNDVFKSGLDLASIGLLAYLISLPHDWIVYKTKLHIQLGIGRERLNTAFEKLVEAGYIVTIKKVDPITKLFDYEHIVYDKPFNGEPLTENPYTGKPQTENTSLLSTNITKERITKETTQSTPEFEEFKNFAVTHKSTIDLNALKLKYNSWVENGWKNGNNKPIKNWKSTLLNTIPYIKERQKDPEPIKGIKLGMK